MRYVYEKAADQRRLCLSLTSSPSSTILAATGAFDCGARCCKTTTFGAAIFPSSTDAGTSALASVTLRAFSIFRMSER